MVGFSDEIQSENCVHVRRMYLPILVEKEAFTNSVLSLCAVDYDSFHSIYELWHCWYVLFPLV